MVFTLSLRKEAMQNIEKTLSLSLLSLFLQIERKSHTGLSGQFFVNLDLKKKILNNQA